jgi:hypothetical protein
LYLATDNYDDAPKVRSDNQLPEGTHAPASNFASSFIGKTLDECAEWLQSAPDDVALHREYFTALNEHSKVDDTVLLCRMINSKLQYFPVSTGDTVVEMMTSHGTKFDERLQNYQRQRMRDSKPDRSKGKPYTEFK